MNTEPNTSSPRRSNGRFRAKVDAAKEGIQDALEKLAGISDVLEHQNKRCEQLVQKAALVQTRILERVSTAPATDEAATRLRADLSKAVNDIHALITKRDGKRTLTRYQELVEPEIHMLEEALDSLLAKFSVITVVHVSERVDRLEQQRDGALVYQVPVDLPLLVMPPKPVVFNGRDELVESIVQGLCEAGNCHIPILGPGGIGKTAVAAAVINDGRIVTKYGANRIFLSCEGVPTCDGIVSMLAVNLRLHHDTDARRAVFAYLTSLSRVLFVIDNAETALDSEDRANVENWMGTIAGEAHISLMITMRGSSPPTTVRWRNVFRDPLLPLTLSASRATWLAHGASEDAELDTLLNMLDGLPIAIMLMATLDRVAKPAELIDRYESEKTSLMSNGGTTRLTSLEISIRLSLNSHTMVNSPGAADLLSILCLLPDGMLVAAMTKALPSLSKHGSVLVKTGLAIREKERIRCLAPIREFILKSGKLPSAPLADLRLFFMNMTKRVDDLGGEGSRDAIGCLSAEFSNILFLLRHFWIERSGDAIDDTWRATLTNSTFNISDFSTFARLGDCSDLLGLAFKQLEIEEDAENTTRCIQLRGYALEARNQYDEALRRYDEAKERYQTSGNFYRVAQCTQSIGDIFCMQSKYDEATAVLEEARVELSATGSRLGVAQCTRSIGDILRMQSKYDEAAAVLQDARTEFLSIGSRFGAAQCTQSIGDTFYMQDRYDQAAVVLEEARVEFRAVGFRLGAAQCTRSIGNIFQMQSKYDEAATVLTEARVEFRAIGNRLGAAQCTRSLGDIFRMLDKYDEAIAVLEEARMEFRAIGSRLGAAQCTQRLGDTFRMQSKYEEALTVLEEVRVEFRAIGSRLGVAQCSRNIGEIFVAQSRYDEAVTVLEEARLEFRAIGDRVGAAQCTQSIGDTFYMQDRYDQAAAVFEEARVEFRAIGSRLGAAQCTRSLGDIFLMLDKYDEAARVFAEAQLEFRAIGERLGVAQCTQSIGDIFLMLDKYDEAAPVFAEAQLEFCAIGERLGVAQCTQSIGKMFGVQSKYDEATAVLEEARLQFRAIGNRLGAAQCTQTIGEIFRMQGQYQEALARIEEARVQFQAIGQLRSVDECVSSTREVQAEQARLAGHKRQQDTGILRSRERSDGVARLWRRLRHGTPPT
ncbi:TPR-like protein [Dacryopinax primogenitus]|uniref:TPR-like protein n=1 Tax=Dacryopinax primogenitus (strain DJM 731) TaxID=1858805 RepID=M5FXF9_DACPD|nr:TPR-like protein [Dacryopinax primogenitus]EJU02676.1 TPR-like protein [Dacryopinax primogenitus]